MITVKHFTAMGMRTMPIGKPGYTLVRDHATLKKFIRNKYNVIVPFKDAMPEDWTQAYGKVRTEHPDTPLGGVICGVLNDLHPGEIQVIALDCDDDNTWQVFRALDPEYPYHFRSLGKPGGTLLYLLPEELKAVYQYSIKNAAFKFEYMALRESGSNSMVYLPTTANQTKQVIAEDATIGYPPAPVIALLQSLAPSKTSIVSTAITATGKLPYNAPLLQKYVDEIKACGDADNLFGRQHEVSEVSKRVYQIFTPKEFRACLAYDKNGWLHPNDDEIAPYSRYIVGVSSIAGADPSVDTDLYLAFMQAINAQIDVPYKVKRYIDEVLSPMVDGKAKINNEPIWKYDPEWDQRSLTIVNQYGENLEYFIDELTPNSYLEYNHYTKTLLPIKYLKNLLERVYSVDSRKESELPSKSLVKKMRLLQEIHTVKQEPGLYVGTDGKMVINVERACLPLQILRDPSMYHETITDQNLYAQAFDCFLAHLLNNDQASMLFMKQLIAYHGFNLTAIPVIVYIVGVGGAGKSEFAFMLEKLFGSNVTRRPQPKHLTSQWNDFLENCAILILSETGDASRRDQEGIKSILKQVTGERTMDISARFKPLRNNVPMFVLPILLTNSAWYQEDVKDRRLFPIVPTAALNESEVVKQFEKQHSVRLTEFIQEGIDKGVISKWLSSYRPDVLPPVPAATQSAMQVADIQSDPITKVKRLAVMNQLYELITLMEDYDVTGFFEIMNSAKPSNNRGDVKNYLYRNHLVELVKNMREGSLYPLDNVITKAFAPNNWLEMNSKCSPNTVGAGLVNYKIVGRNKWHTPDLEEIYHQWCSDSLKYQEDED